MAITFYAEARKQSERGHGLLGEVVLCGESKGVYGHGWLGIEISTVKCLLVLK